MRRRLRSRAPLPLRWGTRRVLDVGESTEDDDDEEEEDDEDEDPDEEEDVVEEQDGGDVFTEGDVVFLGTLITWSSSAVC